LIAGQFVGDRDRLVQIAVKPECLLQIKRTWSPWCTVIIRTTNSVIIISSVPSLDGEGFKIRRYI